jgi:hypothetical protein
VGNDVLEVVVPLSREQRFLSLIDFGWAMAVSAIANTMTGGGVPEKARSGEAFLRVARLSCCRRVQLRLVLLADFETEGVVRALP